MRIVVAIVAVWLFVRNLVSGLSGLSGPSAIFGGASFSPTSIPDLVSWQRADGILWQDSARTIQASVDGDPVGAWDDGSGNGNHATQAVGSKRPTLKVIFPRPVVRFDGTDDLLSFGDLAAFDFGTNPFSIFVVVQTNTGAKGSIFIKNDSSAGANGIYIFRRTVAAEYSYFVAANNLFGASDADFHLLTVVRASTGANDTSLYYDGDAATAITDGRTLSNALEARLGANSDGGEILLGDIAEVIVYSRAVTTLELAQIRAYLNTKYALY